MSRIGHADPRPLDDRQGFRHGVGGNIEIVADQVVSVEARVDVHRFAQQPGALGPSIDIFHWLDRPQQHCGRMAFGLGHDIHAAVYPIDHVYVGVARRAKHDLRSLRLALGRMCGEIVRPEIRLDFHNPADALEAARYMDQVFPEQLPGDHDGISIIKGPHQFLHYNPAVNPVGVVALHLIGHHDLVVPGAPVELGQQRSGFIGDDSRFSVLSGKSPNRIERPPEGDDGDFNLIGGRPFEEHCPGISVQLS